MANASKQANHEKGVQMLHKTKTLKGYKLDSLDGEMGKARFQQRARPD